MVAANPPSRFQKQQRPMKVAPPVMLLIDAIKEEMETRKMRQVTYSEVLEELAKTWESARALEAAAKAAAG